MHTIDQLIDELYAVKNTSVTFCGDFVRGTKEGFNGYIQKGVDCPLWKVYHRNKGYICGMDTVHDAFRALQLTDELKQGATD